MEWIKDITGYIPRKESIMALNDHNYGKLATKYADRNILILFCKPSDPKCQKIIAGYLVAADVFRVFFLYFRVLSIRQLRMHYLYMQIVLYILIYVKQIQ